MKSDATRLLTAFLVLTAIVSGCATTAPKQAQLTPQQQRLLDEINGILNATIAETENKLEKRRDPTSPMLSFMENLKEKKAYLEDIEAGNAPYHSDRLAEMRDEIRAIRVNIENPVERVMKADITFGLGKYKITDLSKKGQNMLGEFTRDVIQILLGKQKRLFPAKIPVIVIRTIGYADEAPPGPDLAKQLDQSIGSRLSADPIKARQQRNIELSRRRAGAIAEYVIKRLKENLDEGAVIIRGPEIIGMGEAHPYPENLVSPPYAPIDQRRRICKIHGNVLIEKK